MVQFVGTRAGSTKALGGLDGAHHQPGTRFPPLSPPGISGNTASNLGTRPSREFPPSVNPRTARVSQNVIAGTADAPPSDATYSEAPATTSGAPPAAPTASGAPPAAPTASSAPPTLSPEKTPREGREKVTIAIVRLSHLP